MIYTSIPYDEGWTVKIDDRKVEYVKILDGLIGVDVDTEEFSEGEHVIELKYKVPGLMVGIIISFLALVSCIAYEVFMKVFVYRKCSTCMKALKWLEAHNVEFEERAIKEENPTYEELKEWYTMSGLPLKKFFNTSGMIYKQMNLKDKLKEMTEDDQLKLLATDGMLVKRPLVIGDNFVLTGFKEKEWEEKLL